jgi:hypothetical protein
VVWTVREREGPRLWVIEGQVIGRKGGGTTIYVLTPDGAGSLFERKFLHEPPVLIDRLLIRLRVAAESGETLFAVALSQNQRGFGAFDGVLERLAFEPLPAALDARGAALGGSVSCAGLGESRQTWAWDQAIVSDFDGLHGDRSLKFPRRTHGVVRRWRGGVAMRARRCNSSPLLQIGAPTGDRQEKIRKSPRILLFKYPREVRLETAALGGFPKVSRFGR